MLPTLLIMAANLQAAAIIFGGEREMRGAATLTLPYLDLPNNLPNFPKALQGAPAHTVDFFMQSCGDVH